MGQRLNIEIENNKRECLANCYYHWAGYTSSSLEITKCIIEYLKTKEVSYDAKGAVEVLLATGASFNEEAWKEAVKMNIVTGDFSECNGRNAGLIAVDEKNIDETRKWEEGRITINIENKTFYFNCADDKDYIDYEDIWEKISDMFYEIKEIENVFNIPFDKIDVLIEGVKKAEDEFRGRFFIGCSCFISIY